MAEEAKKAQPTLTSGRFKLAEGVRNVWAANLEYGLTLEDILAPSYWAFVAPQLTPYDQIEARAEDGSWVAYLIVTGVDRTWARVAVDRVVKLTTSDVSITQAAAHDVVWKGPQLKYTVVRLSDSAKIKEGFKTKDEAAFWLREYERTVG